MKVAFSSGYDVYLRRDNADRDSFFIEIFNPRLNRYQVQAYLFVSALEALFGLEIMVNIDNLLRPGERIKIRLPLTFDTDE